MSVLRYGVTQGAIQKFKENNLQANNAGYIVQVTTFVNTSIIYTYCFLIVPQTNNEIYYCINK